MVRFLWIKRSFRSKFYLFRALLNERKMFHAYEEIYMKIFHRLIGVLASMIVYSQNLRSLWQNPSHPETGQVV